MGMSPEMYNPIPNGNNIVPGSAQQQQQHHQQRMPHVQQQRMQMGPQMQQQRMNMQMQNMYQQQQPHHPEQVPHHSGAHATGMLRNMVRTVRQLGPHPQQPQPGVRSPMYGQIKRNYVQQMRPAGHPGNPNQPMMIRQRLAYPPSAQTVVGPPTKKIKMEDPDDCQMISMQPRRDGLPIIHSVQGGGAMPPVVGNRSSPNPNVVAANEIQLSDQITLSVKGNNVKNPKDVANILANRGITVTPTAKSSTDKTSPTSSSSSSSSPVTTTTTTTTTPHATSTNASTNEAVQKIQLNSSVSIISKKKPAAATIDLSNDDDKSEMLPPPPPPTTTRMAVSKLHLQRPVMTCPVVNCNRRFVTHEGLNLHTRSGHRGVVAMKAYRCKLCPTKFATMQSLYVHQRNVHRTAIPAGAIGAVGGVQPQRATTADELGLPVVDIRNDDTRNKLAALGIVNYIPLTNLNRITGGQFGLPIVSVQGAANAAVCNLAAIGADSVLSIGTVKQVPRMRPA